MTERERKRAEAEERFASEHPEQHMRRRDFLARTAALAGMAGLASVLPAEALVHQAAKQQVRRALPDPRNMPLDHIVVLMMENRSFDHYFGWHPDADAKNAGLSYPDKQGNLHQTHPLAPDFQGCAFDDPDHSWDGGRTQYNGGKLDGFDMTTDEFAIGYYNQQDLPFIPSAADAYTLYDRYFCSLLSETWPNRLYMYSAQSGGVIKNDSPALAAQKFNSGGLYTWETIFDRLLAKGLSVKYYGSDLPFVGVWGSRYLGITSTVSDYYADAAAGTLPNVAFVDPPFIDGGGGNGLSGDEHPHGDIRIGQAFMSDVTHAFIGSPNYKRGVLFINYDEWGGFFDHVSPRLVPDDRSSPDIEKNFGITGFRIPGVAVSPFSRKGGVSHMTVTHESILKLISYRYGLGYLNMRHRYASNIGHSLDFENPDFDLPQLPDPATPATLPCSVQGREASSEQERAAEGHRIGDPVVIEYLEAIGYKVEPATPERIFRNPSSVKGEVGELWKAQARAEARSR
jgi:phospholipase C